VTPQPIVVVGSVNADLHLTVPHLPAAGETVLASGRTLSGGGKGANQALQVARLGHPVEFVARVGDDPEGTAMLDALRAEGISTTHVRPVPGAATGHAVVTSADGGENSIVVVPGANHRWHRLDLSDIDAALGGAALLLLQLEIPLSVVRHALASARRAGVPVLLNVAPATTLPDSLWRGVDYLVANRVEAAHLSGVRVAGRASAGRAAKMLALDGPSSVIITLGADGGVVAGRDGSSATFASWPAATVDSTAAGDAFCGALAVAFVEGMQVGDAVAFAARAGALATTRRGAQAALPTRRRIAALAAAPTR